MVHTLPLRQTLCYQQAARLMIKGASLSVALRGCMRDRGSRISTGNIPGTQVAAESQPAQPLPSGHTQRVVQP